MNLQEVLNNFGQTELGTIKQEHLTKIGMRKKVYELNRDGQIIKIWSSREQLKRDTNIIFKNNKMGLLITSDKRILCSDPTIPNLKSNIRKRLNSLSKIICQYTTDGKLINEFPTVYSVSKTLNIQMTTVNRILKNQYTKNGKLITSNDFYFRYK